MKTIGLRRYSRMGACGDGGSEYRAGWLSRGTGLALFAVMTLVVAAAGMAAPSAAHAVNIILPGTYPCAVAVNPVTNKVYVANYGGDSVTVIDGATNSTTTVAVGTMPSAVAVNPVTNKVYVANAGSTIVTVIDGATNSATTVAAGT